ncbi:MAG: DUF4416 family protein [Deltaproteobacteria bacterium]|nr:DUF4416 family protein [Deltaproteobacteria bacterium]
MSFPRNPLPCKLIAGIIYSPTADLESAKKAISERLGGVEAVSEIFPFDQTDYYSEEMGRNLYRVFCVIEGLFNREFLVDAKLESYEVEKEYSERGRRLVNIDPGIITLENYLLSTFKNFYHRIYLGKGVFGEVTLYYMRGAFRELPWTYPDYRHDRVKSFLRDVREVLYRETIGKGMRHDTEYDGLR